MWISVCCVFFLMLRPPPVSTLLYTLFPSPTLFRARYDSALEHLPNDPLGRLLRGTLYAFRGQGAAAVRDTEHARLLTPLDPHRFFFDSLAASACIAAEDYARAPDLAQQSLPATRPPPSPLRVQAGAPTRRRPTH